MPDLPIDPAVFPQHGHDHDACVDEALAAAGQLCLDRGARLTELRRRVLELVWTSHRPIGAYEILERLAERERRRAAPPTVYRALDFLLENGLVHRVESLNAFIGCSHPGRAHVVEILLCTVCGRAAEVTDRDLERAVQGSASRHGFVVDRQTIELTGRCAACSPAVPHG